MTAKEAKQVSIESKTIMEKISEAAFNGLNKIIIDDNINNIVYFGLQKLGYSIKSISGKMNESSYEISW